jgi:hypothetical protein
VVDYINHCVIVVVYGTWLFFGERKLNELKKYYLEKIPFLKKIKTGSTIHTKEKSNS